MSTEQHLTDEKKFEALCKVLGLDATVQAVQGDRVGTVVQGPAKRGHEVQQKVKIRWDDDGTDQQTEFYMDVVVTF